MNRIANHKVFSVLCALIMCLAAERVLAEQDPINMLKQVTDQVMKSLVANGDSYRANPSKLYSMVDSVIIPHADFDEMARWVVGREAWRAANDETRKAFTVELKKLAVRTYARSLLNYSNHTIEFMPLRQPVERKARIQVSSIVKEGDQGSLRLDYRLVRHGETWKVYDIIIEGVSLIYGYRAQFEDAIRSGGIEAALSQVRGREGT